jgi:hypothetical protein
MEFNVKLTGKEVNVIFEMSDKAPVVGEKAMRTVIGLREKLREAIGAERAGQEEGAWQGRVTT